MRPGDASQDCSCGR